FPSLLTFFNVVASLESGARARGGRGFVVWFGRLPWGDPSVAAQVLAMLLFAFGGVGGLINASQPEPRRAPHRLDAGSPPPHRGHRRDADVHRNHVLARSGGQWARAVEPTAGPDPGVALVHRHGRLLELAPSPRLHGDAAAHGHRRLGLSAAGVARGP